MFTGLSGSFDSPGYPHNYPNNANCIYNIQVPRHLKILLVLHFFDLDTGYDKLELRQMVSGSNNIVAKLTGHSSTARNYTSEENRFSLLFTSNHITTRRGFRASYRAIHLGKQINFFVRKSVACFSFRYSQDEQAAIKENKDLKEFSRHLIFVMEIGEKSWNLITVWKISGNLFLFTF